MKLNDNFLAQIRKATELLRTSGPSAATAAIQRALKGETAAPPEAGTTPEFIDINPVTDKASEKKPGNTTHKAAGVNIAGFLKRFRRQADTQWTNPVAGQMAEDVQVLDDVQSKAPTDAPGRIVSGSCTSQAGTRQYELYVPSGYRNKPLPLIVMLHGCKQSPGDFAAGTGMNRLAEEYNCLVVYPGQTARANGSNCWNWFNPSDQRRDQGEPSIIADMTRQIMREYRVDPNRVYVAGLSAGGAMAGILAANYPDLFAAVGIHSGLPVGSAHDVASAFGAMKGNKSAKLASYRQAVPAIVFHGDRDHTVHPDNGEQALNQSIGLLARNPHAEEATYKTRIVNGESTHGRSYTQTLYLNAEDKAIAEHWVIQGAGHAWAGGSKAGSYTDPKGPDASSEMIRFFYTHANAS